MIEGLDVFYNKDETSVMFVLIFDDFLNARESFFVQQTLQCTATLNRVKVFVWKPLFPSASHTSVISLVDLSLTLPSLFQRYFFIYVYLAIEFID